MRAFSAALMTAVLVTCSACRSDIVQQPADRSAKPSLLEKLATASPSAQPEQVLTAQQVRVALAAETPLDGLRREALQLGKAKLCWPETKIAGQPSPYGTRTTANAIADLNRRGISTSLIKCSPSDLSSSVKHVPYEDDRSDRRNVIAMPKRDEIYETTLFYYMLARGALCKRQITLPTRASGPITRRWHGAIVLKRPKNPESQKIVDSFIAKLNGANVLFGLKVSSADVDWNVDLVGYDEQEKEEARLANQQRRDGLDRCGYPDADLAALEHQAHETSGDRASYLKNATDFASSNLGLAARGFTLGSRTKIDRGVCFLPDEILTTQQASDRREVRSYDDRQSMIADCILHVLGLNGRTIGKYSDRYLLFTGRRNLAGGLDVVPNQTALYLLAKLYDHSSLGEKIDHKR